MVEKTEDYGREADLEISRDPADQASSSYTKELLFSQSTNERNTLRLIDDALERISDGKFGHCLNCNNDIQIRRLEALPWARFCIKCQELLEQGMLTQEEA